MKWVVGFAVWLALVVSVLGYYALRDRARVGAGYVAKEICSCVHVGGRAYDACRADLPAGRGFERVRSEPLASGDGVRAFVPGLAERVARAAPERGCTLE